MPSKLPPPERKPLLERGAPVFAAIFLVMLLYLPFTSLWHFLAFGLMAIVLLGMLVRVELRSRALLRSNDEGADITSRVFDPRLDNKGAR